MIALQGARVCVTSGARGIGAATAAALVERGAIVWIGDRDLAAATATADRLGHRAHAHHLDVTDVESFSAFIDAASARGPIDMLVNNAGIQHMGRLVDQDLDALQRELDINLGAVLTGTRLVLPGMIEHGRGEVTVPRYLAGMGILEELIPSPIMWWLKRFVGGADYGAFDPAQRRDYLDRSRAS
ncbi:SDR family NAD(P)-dependent oxidoreductase [Gordonia westfalica]|uniref:Short chain dehydrogenase n=1 Tax=Gordonia westfalica TaxID=158898 RepID=A0A1H2HPN4_9ACTN|nr:SDR family NAD(P)-dependent oxidoreductase [Gordonia westfalica]SDU33814.1 short chain dehydrogenase [Gordonia westfalica]